MGMTINIQIDDPETIESLMAVGASDLKNHFLKKIHIEAKQVRIHHITKDEINKRLAGKEHTYYEDVAK
jgi:hypothetical protein